jgi:hypothetical protein
MLRVCDAPHVKSRFEETYSNFSQQHGMSEPFVRSAAIEHDLAYDRSSLGLRWPFDTKIVGARFLRQCAWSQSFSSMRRLLEPHGLSIPQLAAHPANAPFTGIIIGAHQPPPGTKWTAAMRCQVCPIVPCHAVTIPTAPPSPPSSLCCLLPSPFPSLPS